MKKHKESSKWADIPSELAVSIFLRLGAVEILINAQKVCKSWYRVCKDPSMWRTIDMRKYRIYDRNYDFDSMCRHAVDRSEGGLVEINISSVFCNDSLLTYIADKSSNLRKFSLEMFYPLTNEGLTSAVAKLPLLEELEVTHLWSTLDLKPISKSCPKLKILKLENLTYVPFWTKRRPQVCHFQPLGNGLTKAVVKPVLGSCPHVPKLSQWLR